MLIVMGCQASINQTMPVMKASRPRAFRSTDNHVNQVAPIKINQTASRSDEIDM